MEYIAILSAFVLGYLLSEKSINTGLRWKQYLENNVEPVITNPIKEIFTKVEESKLKTINDEVLDEYLNGAKKE